LTLLPAISDWFSRENCGSTLCLFRDGNEAQMSKRNGKKSTYIISLFRKFDELQ
jgi:hypothetical protein